jgi:hypothetical protein
MKNIGIIFTFLFLSISVGISNPTYASNTKLPSSIQPIDPNGLNEGKAYRLLYDNQVKSNDAILKTIFYALGGLATAIVLVFASNWWFNEKKVDDIRRGINAQINEAKNDALNEVEVRINVLTSEKSSQINELQIKLQGEITASISKIMARFNEFHEQIRAEIREDNKTLLNNYQSQLETFNENYRQQIATLIENIKNQIENIKDKIVSTEDKLKNVISSKTNELERKVARNEFYLWKHGKVMENALTAQIHELELLVADPDQNKDYDFYLEGIVETLEGLSGAEIYWPTKETIINIVKKVPEKYNVNKNAVLANLEKIKFK